MLNKKIGLVFLVILLTSPFLIGEIQTGGGEIGIDLIPEIPINYSLVPTVNSSDYWDNLDAPNATQFDSGADGITLNIKESWFTIIWNAIFGTKTTDDLSEGSTNKYDNVTWNETRGNELYTNQTYVDTNFYNKSANIDSINYNLTINYTCFNSACDKYMYDNGSTLIIKVN